MTPKQLERKARQLHSRKRLAETVGELEETIKTFMVVQGDKEIQTEKFIIKLIDGNLEICIRPAIDPNQLNLDFEDRSLPSRS